MILKWIFDRIVAFIGLAVFWPILLIVAILIKIKMPGGPAFFVQKRVGKDGRLFDCHKFRTMTVKHNGSTVSVAGDSRITPLGATLRHWKLDELPGLWDVLIGNMSFVGPRPDVPGYADKLVGDDRDVLKLRPGITGPATLKYRLEDEMISEYVAQKQASGDTRPMQEIAVEYNDTVIKLNMMRGFKRVQYSPTCKGATYYTVTLVRWEGGCPYSEWFVKFMYNMSKFVARTFWTYEYKFRFWYNRK